MVFVVLDRFLINFLSCQNFPFSNVKNFVLRLSFLILDRNTKWCWPRLIDMDLKMNYYLWRKKCISNILGKRIKLLLDAGLLSVFQHNIMIWYDLLYFPCFSHIIHLNKNIYGSFTQGLPFWEWTNLHTQKIIIVD